MKVIGVIPARLRSVRLPEKVLKEIAGRTMIEHVWQKAKQVKKLTEVIIACDDEKIVQCAGGFGAQVIQTSTEHPNGTSRIVEVAEKVEGDIYINIQGDQPIFEPEAIDALIEAMLEKDVQVGTLAMRTEDRKEYENPNTVKVVCDQKGNALYFSRAQIPFYREGFKNGSSFLKHIGVYGFRRDTLLDFAKWPASELEEIEKLEQLRILEHGHDICVVETQHDFVSVDTQEDLEKAQELITG